MLCHVPGHKTVRMSMPHAHPHHQDDDIPGVVRYRTYEVLKEETANPRLRWAYLPYSMHMAGPREAIQVGAGKRPVLCVWALTLVCCETCSAHGFFVLRACAVKLRLLCAFRMGWDRVPM
jgi:hypothetical protein